MITIIQRWDRAKRGKSSERQRRVARGTSQAYKSHRLALSNMHWKPKSLQQRWGLGSAQKLALKLMVKLPKSWVSHGQFAAVIGAVLPSRPVAPSRCRHSATIKTVTLSSLSIGVHSLRIYSTRPPSRVGLVGRKRGRCVIEPWGLPYPSPNYDRDPDRFL